MQIRQIANTPSAHHRVSATNVEERSDRAECCCQDPDDPSVDIAAQQRKPELSLRVHCTILARLTLDQVRAIRDDIVDRVERLIAELG
jgi:hypothetical protein